MYCNYCAKQTNKTCRCDRLIRGEDKSNLVTEQTKPMEERSFLPVVWNLVLEDMKLRDQIGRQRYGTPLQPFNGRDALVDAYQEALDLVVYLRQAIWERDNKKETP